MLIVAHWMIYRTATPESRLKVPKCRSALSSLKGTRWTSQTC